MTKETKKIEVVPYNPAWPKQFTSEESLIKQVLGDNCLAVHHVGSTSVPGLAAKPIIDILAVVKQPESAIQQLETVGYAFRGEYNIPFHYGFSKREEVEVNLHVYQEGNPEIELNLTFRDFLRTHPEISREYAKLKQNLLKKPSSHEKNGSMFTGYNLGKGSFILSILKQAGFQRLRMLRCTHHNEWEVAKKLRQTYFFDQVPIEDPYQWTFNHPDHVHYVLYQGVVVVGYAHIQLWPDNRTAIRIIVIEESHRNQGWGRQFLEWIESWLFLHGRQSIHTEASPNAVKFYRQNGYKEMPFNDPDEYESGERDTPMGKLRPII